MPNFSGIWTVTQQMQAKGQSLWPPLVPVVGSALGGGYFAGQIGVGGVATHNLVVGPLSTAQSTLAWKNANTFTTGAKSDIDGPQNTADMVAAGNATVYPCAHLCNDLSTGGQTDWYMPAKNELEVCYYNLKPSTAANNTASGINPNAVPARASNYTNSPSVPAQTSATDFQSGGTQAFTASFYWPSTESSVGGNIAWIQNFSNGYQGYSTKTPAYLVRAIRRVAV